MAKRLNYEIGFTADTSQLKSALQDTIRDLNKISSLHTGEALTQDMVQAAKSAQQLSGYLNQAININTGKLDLGKFSASLKAGGIDLKTYADRLQAIGPQGEKAFLSLASAISKTDLPLIRSSKLLDDLWTTMKNTARWQLTSSALHGFMGGLQTCYGYAQDLNSSLNNIRIVTGQSTEQMANFARQANNAAKALSSTTTRYTDAALIYYQQGLSDEQVKNRTDTTIKMSNVTAASAKEVSDQMTAIWNNFYDGSKSLEYYADVITALGAATASSSAEISTGLEKFAAIAQSVGLSYEYATSALATVTATTRQSADIVGTAFKTLFARIQGLSLGETLDDGTDLNKYSEALMKVGISIKDQNGELKQMDIILDEMAAKWETLSKDQQLALTQTVAGVRQYNQLVALMDNWDFMEENLATVTGSTGTLQKQADIYAESWEAARNRVRAAAEDIYDSIINPKTFIDIDNAITPLLTGIADTIDTLGGLKGILITTGYIMTSLYGDKIAQGIRDMAYNVSVLTGKEIEHQRAIKQTTAEIAKQMATDSANMTMSNIDNTTLQAQKVGLQIQLNEKAKELSTIQYEQFQNEINLVEAIGQATLAYAGRAQKAKESSDQMAANILLSDNALLTLSEDAAKNLHQNLRESWKKINNNKPVIELNDIMDWNSKQKNNLKNINLDNFLIGMRNLSKYTGTFNIIREQLDGLSKEFSSTNPKVQQLANQFHTLTDRNLNIDSKKAALEQLEEELKNTTQETELLKNALRTFNVPTTVIDQFIAKCREAAEAEAAGQNSTELYKEAIEELRTSMENAKGSMGGWATTIVNVARQISSLAMAWQSFQSLGSIWDNDDLSAGEKITQTLVSLGMIIPTITSSISGLTAAFSSNTLAKIANGEITEGLMAKIFANKAVTIAETGALEFNTAALWKNIAATLAKVAPVLAVVAAVGALIGILYLAVKAYNADADAAKQAAEAARETAQAAEEAKSAADQLRSSINAYDSAVEKLNECTKGTQEWRDALKEVNEAAIEVLNNAGKLSAEELANLRNDDGTLNRDAIANLQERADERASNLAYASAAADKYAADMQLRADAMELGREAYSFRDEYDGEGDRDVLLENYEELAKLSKTELIPALRKLGFQIADSGSTVDTWYDSIQNMADNAMAASEKFNLITQMKIEDILGPAEADSDKAIQKIVTEKTDELTQSLTKKWEKYLTGSGISKTSSADNAKYKETLRALQEAGYDLSAQYKNAVRGSDTKRELAFLDSEGNEKVYNAEQIASMIAAAQALEEVNQNAKQAAEVVNNLVNVFGGDTGTGLQNYITSGNFESMSRNDLDNLIASASGYPSVAEYIQGQLKYTEEEMAEVFRSDDWLNDINKQINNYDIAFDNFKSGLLLSVQKALDSLDDDVKTLGLPDLEVIGKAMEDAMVYAGKESLDVVKSTIDALDEDNIEDFADVLGTINWDTQGPEEFITALDEAGVETKLTTEQLTAFGKAMSRVNKSKDFDALAKEYAEIQKIIEGLEIGDTISAEDYEKLDEASQSYFTRMLDGTYKLTKDAEEFYNLVQQKQLEDFKEQRSQRSNRIRGLQRIQGYDINTNNLTLADVYEDQALLGQMLDTLEVMGHSKRDLADWRQGIFDENGKPKGIPSADAFYEMRDAIASYSEELKNIDELIAKEGSELYQLNLSIVAQTATSIGELVAAQNELNISNADYARLLDIVTEKEAERYDIDVNDIEDLADAYSKTAGYLDLTESETRALAIQNIRMNRGIATLIDNWEDWSKVIEEVNLGKLNKTSLDYIDTVQDLSDAISDLVGASKDLKLSETFFDSTENVKLLEQAIQGSVKAINQLGVKVAMDSFDAATAGLNDYDTIDAELVKIESAISGGMIDDDAKSDLLNLRSALLDFPDKIAIVKSGFAGLFNAIQTGGEESAKDFIQRGESMGADWAKALNDMALVTGMSVESMKSMLESAGVQAEVVSTTKRVKQTVPKIVTVERLEWVPGVGFAKTSSSYQDGVDTFWGDMEVAQINMGASGDAPDIKYVGNTSAGATPSSTSGDSGKKDLPKRKNATPLNDMQDRYHEINDQIDDVTRATKRLNAETDRLYGAKKFANMDKEIAKLKEQAGLIEEKKKQAEDYLNTDKGALVSAAAGVGFTLNESSFDAEGNLLNVEEIQRSMWEKLRDMETKYNSIATSEEQDKYEEEVLQPWQDKVDEFERALSTYEETRELMQDLEEERMELLRQIEDVRFDKIIESIEIKIDYKDAKKDLNDLAKTIRESVGSAYDWGKDVANIDFQNMEIERSKIAEYQEEYSKLLALSEEAKTNPAIDQKAIAEQFKELRGQVIGTTEALVEWAESLEEVLPDAIDAAREHFDQFIDQLEHNTSIIDTIKEIMVLQGLTLKTEKGFNDIQDMHQKRMDATLGQAKLNRAWYERATKQLQEAQAALDATPRDTQQYDILKANRDALLQEQNEAQEAMLQSAKEAMDEANNMYVDAVERTAYELEQTLTKGQGFDLLQDKYDHYLDTEERYLDTVNKIYETTTLNNKLQKEIDKTSNIAGATRLKALQEEFQLRQANNKLSQYDIDIMNAKLELTLKQMALEEAQNNKNQLRLIRNAQGNWNYQYTADQDDIDAANQEYLDASNEYYNLAKDKVKETSGEIIDTWQEMTEKIKEIYGDQELTVEEREARIAEIRLYYTQKVKDLETEKQKAISDMTEAGNLTIDTFRKQNEDILVSMGDNVDGFETKFSGDLLTILGNTDEFNNEFAEDMDTMSGEIEGIDKVFKDTIDKMNGHANTFNTNIQKINGEVGTSYDELKIMFDKVSESTEIVTERGLSETEMMWNKLDALREVTEGYSNMAKAILESVRAMEKLAAETMKAQFEDISDVENIDSNADKANQVNTTPSSPTVQNDSKSVSTNENELEQMSELDKKGIAYAIWNGNAGWGTGITRKQNIEEKFGPGSYQTYQSIVNDYDIQKKAKNGQWTNDLGIYSYDELIKKYGIGAFATGGYTGEFNDAKLAFLHEKELILNADDTKNILAAVQAVRAPNLWHNVVIALEKSIAIAQGMMIDKLTNASAPIAQVTNDQSIKEATIYAEFPNVHDARDIEEALYNLANDASQYASQPNRK